VQDGLPSSSLKDLELGDKPFTTLLTEAGMVQTGREVKDALGRNAVQVNHMTLGNDDNMRTEQIFIKENALFSRFFLVKLGKKKYHVFTL
jgi:tyrosyl-tRNA synthetase